MLCINPVRVRKPLYDGSKNFNWVEVPCGKCIQCLRTKRYIWSQRLWLENYYSICSYFVTLTYNDDYLPPFGVSKRDCQLFFKRIRKLLPKFRYFLVSEYGDQFGRAHYHMSLFFQKEVDVVCLVKALDKAWPFGFSQVGDVNMSSIQYLSKYMLKDKVDNFGQNPTFSLMSRRPGIGAALLTDSKFLLTHNDSNMNLSLNVDGYVGRMPRYFRQKLFNKFKLTQIYEQERQKRVESATKRNSGNGKEDRGYYRDRAFRLALQSKRFKP